MPPHLNAVEQQCCIPLGHFVRDFVHCIYLYIYGIYVYAATVILCVATQPASKLKDLLGGTRGLRVPERALGQKGEK